MTKTIRTLALATAAAVSLGLAGCGSDSEPAKAPETTEPAVSSEAQPETSSRSFDCEERHFEDRISAGETHQVQASPALTPATEHILSEPDLIHTISSDAQWEDTEYIVGWHDGGQSLGDVPELENVKLITSDSSMFYSCDVAEAASVELVGEDNQDWVTYRVTFDSLPDQLGYGRIVFDDPYGEGIAGQDLWNLSGGVAEYDKVGNLLQGTVDPRDKYKTAPTE